MQSGAYLVRVQLGGVHIMGSPFQVTVLAARTNARTSSASGEGLKTSIAGNPASFAIIARDEFGNPRSVCGDDFVVSLDTQADKVPGSASVNGIVSESGNEWAAKYPRAFPPWMTSEVCGTSLVMATS